MRFKIYYGWWIVVSMFIVMLVHSGMAFYVFGIFYKPLIEEFGWNRATVSLAISIYLLTIGFSAPIAGKLTDNFGGKSVLLGGAIIGGFALLLLSQINHLWQFYLLYFFLGLGFSACGVVPVSSVLNNWFIQKRGMAIGIAMAGVSAGAFTITLVSEYLMEKSGWRTTYSFLALLSWLLLIPIILLVMKNTPQEIGILPNGGSHNAHEKHPTTDNKNMTSQKKEIEWTPPMAMRDLSFWLINLAFFLIFLSIGAVLQHEVNFLIDLGIPKLVAASALGLTGGIGGIGKISTGFLADKIPAKYVATITFSLQATAILIILLSESMAYIWVFVVVFGLSMGGQIAIQPLIIGELFGLNSFGTIYGITSMIGASGSALGPFVAGIIYNIHKSYYWVFSGCIIASLVAALLIFLTRHPLSEEEK